MTAVPPGPVGSQAVPTAVSGCPDLVPRPPTINVIAVVRRPNFIRRLPPKVIRCRSRPKVAPEHHRIGDGPSHPSARWCDGRQPDPIGEPNGILTTIVSKSKPAMSGTTLRDQQFRFTLVQGNSCEMYFATERL